MNDRLSLTVKGNDGTGCSADGCRLTRVNTISHCNITVMIFINFHQANRTRPRGHILNSQLRFARVGNVHLAYETYGSASAPPVVLIHGLGQGLTGWPEALFAAIVQEGYRVIRFDNRDIGKSSRLVGKPRLAWLYLRAQFGLKSRAPYTLNDMAHDTVCLIDQLGLGPVHLVGASMGGMIAQIVAARFPAAVRSLTSIMSSSGDPRLPEARADVLKLILNPPKNPSLEAEIEYGVRTWELIASPGYSTPRSEWQQRVRRDLARNAPAAGGTERQFAAILASGSRVSLLASIAKPTLVLHGEQDPLVPVAAGRSTAQHIRGAQFESAQGMGHDFPDALLPSLSSRLVRHFRKADRGGPASPPQQPRTQACNALSTLTGAPT